MKKIVIAALLFAVASCSGAGTGATGGGKREDQSAKQDSAKHAGIPWGKEKDGFSCRAILRDYKLIEEKKILKIECEVQVRNNSTNRKTIIIYPEEGMCMDLPFVLEVKGKKGRVYFNPSLVSTNTTSEVTLGSGETVSTILKAEGSWENKEPGTYSFRLGCGQKGYGFGPLWSNVITLDIPVKERKPTDAPGKSNLWVSVSVTEPLVHVSRLKQFSVHFVMVNDGEKAIDPCVRSWRLNINGKDHPDSQFTFGNGPRDNRWNSLPPDDCLRFTYALGDWFKEPGTYRIVWKGEHFESAPVVFRVLAQ